MAVSYILDSMTGVERLTNGQIIDSFLIYRDDTKQPDEKRDAYARMCGYRMYVLVISSRYAPAAVYFFFDKRDLTKVDEAVETRMNSTNGDQYHKVYSHNETTVFAAAADWDMTIDEATLMLDQTQIEIVTSDILRRFKK
jgi:hypothetical protein